MPEGKFIVLEGGDSAGKTTQISALRDYLDRYGLDLIVTREPGGTLIGEKLRELLLHGENIDPTTELLLHCASRRQHYVDIIRPALEKNIWVISDRFFYSTIAYQCDGMGVHYSVERTIRNYAVCGGFVPDLVLFLDVPPEVAVKRREGTSQDNYEAQNDAFHQRVYAGYKRLCYTNDYMLDINGQLEPDAIKRRIRDIVDQWFNLPQYLE